MKSIISIIILVISIILSLYVGIWVMFAGGIIQIVNSINPLNGIGIAIGILRITFCGIAWLIFYIGLLIAKCVSNI